MGNCKLTGGQLLGWYLASNIFGILENYNTRSDSYDYFWQPFCGKYQLVSCLVSTGWVSYLEELPGF